MGLIPLGFWAASGAGGGAAADYELISTTVLGSSASSVTFSGLGTSAAAYKHLQIRLVGRFASGTGTFGDTYMRFNADTGNNYSWHEVYGFNGSMGSYGLGSTNKIYVGSQAQPDAVANYFIPSIIDIADFASTSKNKTARISNGGISGSSSIIDLSSGAWYSTAAITSINLYGGGDWAAGSRFSLYGLK